MKIMQEQPHYNITPEQGWSKMKASLDEVMPVARPARRFGFLWWSASAVVMSGVMGLYMFNGSHFFMQHPTTALPVLESRQSNNREKNELNDGAKSNETFTKPVTTSPSTNQPVQTSKTSGVKASQKKDAVVPVSTPLKDSKKSSRTEPMAAAEPITLQEANAGMAAVADHAVENGDVLFQQDFSLETTSIQEPVPDIQVRNEQVLESLPVIYGTGVSFSERPESIQYAGSVHPHKTATPLIEPSVSVSGLFGLNDGMGGIAGVGADVNVSKRFSITTGVGYMAYRPDASFFGNSKDLASNAEFNAILNYDPTYEGINTYVVASSVNKGAGYNAINPLIENLRQWQVSSGLKWKMSGRFFVEGGVCIGFGTTAYSEYPIVSGDPNASIPNVRIGNSLNTYDVIRSTMTSVYGGIGYSAGKHVDLFAQWTHGFDTYILSDPGGQFADLYGGARTDYIRGLNLGLKYTL